MSKADIWPVEPTRYWFLIDSEETSSQVLLASVGTDNQIRTYELPGTDMIARFSNRGDRLCLEPRNADGRRQTQRNGWVVTLKERSFVTMELKFPSSRGCWWVSDDIVAFGDAQPEYFMVVGDTLVSVMNPPDIPSAQLQASPNGKYYVESRTDPSGSVTLVVGTGNPYGLVGEPLLAQSRAWAWQWSDDSSNLFVTISSMGGNPAILDFDFSTGTPIEINTLTAMGTWLLPSPNGEFLLMSSTNGGDIFTVWDPIGNSSADIAGAGDFASPGWASNGRLVSWSPNPKVANVSSSVIASGQIVPVSLADPGHTAPHCDNLQLTSTLILEHCAATTVPATLHSLELVGDTLKRTALLPGQLGDDTVGTVTGPHLPSNDARVLIAASPSYYYLEYQGNVLKRTVRLADYLRDYAVNLSTWIPGDVALLAYLPGASSYGWFLLDQPTPGPLMPIPTKISAPGAIHFPTAWPKLQ